MPPSKTNATPTLGAPFAVRGIALQEGVTVEQVEVRRNLLKRLDRNFEELEASNRHISGLDRFSAQAHDIIRSPKARTAFDVSLEPAAIAERFGPSKFAQSCLLATRLIEAGVRFATVSFGGWDTHSNNFKQCQESLLPQLDQGLSALFVTLAERGLLDSTVVYVTGEFGRTPKINDKAGRDHWPRAMFALFAGGRNSRRTRTWRQRRPGPGTGRRRLIRPTNSRRLFITLWGSTIARNTPHPRDVP
jgi:hypothetical protein